MHLNEFEKSIYNQFLFSKRRGKPVRARENFSTIKEEDYIALKKIVGFLNAAEGINVRDFFDAGFEESKNLYLKDFTTMSAIARYKRYTAKKLLDIDSEWTQNLIDESLLFIYDFCKENNSNIGEYLDAKSPSGIPWFIIHLKNTNICLYAVLAFPNCEYKLNIYAADIKFVLSEEFYNSISLFRTKFFAAVCKNKTKNKITKLIKLKLKK